MIPNGDEASTSHNVFNECLEDAYFDASTSFHDPSNVHTYYQPYPHEKKWTKDHPLHKIIAKALRDTDWVSAMQEELDQFKRLKVCRLVPRPEGKSVIKTKWIFKNKKHESSLVIRNQARLLAVGYSQQEGIDYDETFSPIARIEAIRLFLAYAAHKDFTVFQIDYCMEDPEQAFVEYASLCTDKAEVLSARSYPTEDPQCSTYVHGLINAITICPKQPNEPQNDESKEKERGRDGNPEDTNTMAHSEEQRDTPQLELKDTTTIDNLRPNRNDDGIEWLDDKKGDPRNLRIPWMIRHKFTANAYSVVDLPMNIMSLAYYKSIRMNGYEYMGRNFVGLGRDMHVFVGNTSYVMDFTILESIENNIDPSLSYVVFGRPFVEIACLAINRKYGLMTFTDGIKEITFKTPYKDLERSKLSSKGHDLLSSRVILSEDDYDRGCRKPSDLEDMFYRDTIKLGPEYLNGMDDEG
nr:uncharacterized mitochondrial protein AtMg00820-like [Tanacetum cinerariifolium]